MDVSISCHPFSFPMKGVNEKEYRPRKKEDDILIIQSSSVGTSASRRYQSTQMSYAEHTEWDGDCQGWCQQMKYVSDWIHLPFSFLRTFLLL